MFSEKVRNIQGSTLTCITTITVPYTKSLFEWGPKGERRGIGLINCCFPLSFSIFPKEGFLFYCCGYNNYASCSVYLFILYIESLGHPLQNTPVCSFSAMLIRFKRYPCLSSFCFSPVVTFMGIHKKPTIRAEGLYSIVSVHLCGVDNLYLIKRDL